MATHNGHDDKGCEHEVAYCKKCDVAYCKKCGKEWGKREVIYLPTTPAWPNNPYLPDPGIPTYPKWTCDTGTLPFTDMVGGHTACITC
jgi:hypothetical protein